MTKPFHLLTPAERTALRIAQNRAITEKLAEEKSHKPPAKSSNDFTRSTPDERSKLSAGVIRKVQS